MKLLPFLLGIILLAQLPVFGQKQANIWHFGFNAGLDFNTSPPTPLLQGALLTNEGCTSVSDTNGKLLFYSDGQKVWNKNHQVMPNGAGLLSGSALLGNTSATQAVLAVPQPGNPDIYYLFTVDEAESSFINGMRYSVLDLRLDNGLGDLTTKNLLLQGPVTEKLVAIKHANNTDFWIVAHEWNSDGFLAFLLTANGLNTTPVKSNVGKVHTNIPPYFNPGAGLGYMRANGAGTKLALALGLLNCFELFDFDKNTGLVSNPVTSADNFKDAYGVEFSPDGTKLYGTIFSPYNLYQFDLNNSDIFGSGVLIASSSGGIGALQLGPDNRIYTSTRNNYHLGVINQPNNFGLACDFRDQQIYLGGKRAGIGLPNYPNSFLNGPQVSNFTFTSACLGSTTFFAIPNFRTDYTVKWDFGDPASGQNNFSTDASATHQYSALGTYQVALEVQVNGQVVTIKQPVTITAPPTFSLGKDTVLCPGQTLLLGEPAIPGRTYLWQDSSRKSTFLVTKAGRYQVTVAENDCFVSRQLNVTYQPEINASLGPEITICEGDTVLLGGKAATGFQYMWQNGSTSAQLKVWEAGLYSRTSTKGNCSETGSVKVNFKNCEIRIPNLITPNGDKLNDVFALQGLVAADHALQIFNQWGSMVFESKSYQNNWPERDFSSGIYYYFLRQNVTGKTYKGWVELVK